MRLNLRIEGDYARERIEGRETAVGWTVLASMVEEYLSALKPTADLEYQHAQWDMFRQELEARALKPWDDYSLIEAPSGQLWGVERGAKG